MGFTAKVQLTDVRPYGEGDARSVALAFSPDYRDGRNADWAHNTPGLSLSMTVRGDVADRLSLAPGQAFTLTFGRDGEEQGLVEPDVQTESDEAEDVEVPDLAGNVGDTKMVTRTEAARLGYDVSGGAPQGLASTPSGSQQPTSEVSGEGGSVVTGEPATAPGEPAKTEPKKAAAKKS